MSEITHLSYPSFSNIKDTFEIIPFGIIGNNEFVNVVRTK